MSNQKQQEKKLNIYEKIQLVADECRVIEKNLQVGTGYGAYKAVSEYDVTLKVKEAEKKHRIISIPVNVESLSSEIVKTKNKKGEDIMYFVDNVKMTTEIIDLDDITQKVVITTLGKGIDTADKGNGKASTYARKYALLNAYKIVTGEDPDAEKSPEIQPEKIDDMKAKVINAVNQIDGLSDKITSHFGVSKLEDLKNEDIKIVFDKLSKDKKI